MSSKSVIVDPAPIDANGWGAALTGAGPFTITASPGDDLAHQANLTSTDNLSGITLTFTGTDADGNAQTEAITGPNNTTVESGKYWLTLTLITASGTLGANTLDVGWVDEVVSRTIILDPEFPSHWQLDITGTISVDTDWMVKDASSPPIAADQNAHPWLDGANVQSALDAETADSTIAVVVLAGYAAMRFRVNSYSSGGECRAYYSNRTEN